VITTDTTPDTVQPAESPEALLTGLLATPEGREHLALFLVDMYLSPYKGMRASVNVLLKRLAGHLPQEDRWAAFEELVTAVMVRKNAPDHEIDRACARVDAAVHSLCGAL
jgi:hypothetical protein